MGVFDINKNKEQKESPAQEDLIRAKEQFEDNAFQESLSSLSLGFRKDVDYIPLYDLSVKCLEKLDAEEEAELFRSTIQNPEKY